MNSLVLVASQFQVQNMTHPVLKPPQMEIRQLGLNRIAPSFTTMQPPIPVANKPSLPTMTPLVPHKTTISKCSSTTKEVHLASKTNKYTSYCYPNIYTKESASLCYGF
jgi:hypothetical protein